ncbi:stage III sporulation protein AE [Desulfitispora alkaliphila]|uniref:stage III sporulation protein AE n=1 Tax=Desulfitispora alkaliphila TaxID=622674 RepID=UPI003D1CA3D4
MRNYIKKVIVVLMMVFLGLGLCAPTVVAMEEFDPEEQFNRQVESLQLDELDQFLREIDQDLGEYLPEMSLSNLLEQLRAGELDLHPVAVLKGIMNMLFAEVVANITLLGKLIVLTVICAILYNLLTAFEQGSTGKVAHAIAFLVLVSLAIGSFTLAMDTGREAVERMVTFMQILLPVLLTLLTAMGGIATAAILHPVMMLALSLLGTVITKVVFPLIYLSAVLSIVDKISGKFQVSRLASLFKQASTVIMGGCLTIFVAVISIQGVAGAVADGVTIRTAKYVTGAFVPIVGKMLSDVLEAIIGTSLLLKNAVGIVGVLIIFGLTLIPVIKIIAVVIIYKIAAALIQPIDNSGVGDCLQAMAGSLLMAFAAVTAVGVMFFMAVTIIISAGNFTVMIR